MLSNKKTPWLNVFPLLAVLILFFFIPQIQAQPPSSSLIKRSSSSAAKHTPKVQKRPVYPWNSQWKNVHYKAPTVWERLASWLFVFFSSFFWAWVLFAVIALPYLSVWLSRRRKLQHFRRARTAELANPLNADARFQLGNLYLKHKGYRRALPFLQEAYEIQKKSKKKYLDPRVLDALGETLLALGKHNEAIALYEQSLVLGKTGGQGETFLQLGLAFWEINEKEKAKTALEKACRSNRSLAEPVFRLAILYFYQGKSEKGQALIDEFVIDKNQLPHFIRKRNRLWVWRMQLYPWSRWMF